MECCRYPKAEVLFYTEEVHIVKCVSASFKVLYAASNCLQVVIKPLLLREISY